ncbi:MAG: hypothetical protein J6S75_06345, partial [Thermoguttaceae bacterium]|nr:hypothetical protein [Thermoguttaceae bacterium]
MTEQNETNKSEETRASTVNVNTWKTCQKVLDLIQGREKSLDRYGREIAALFLLYQAARWMERNEGKHLPDISEPKSFLQDHWKQVLPDNYDLLQIVVDLFGEKEWKKIKEKFNEYAQNDSISPRGVAREILGYSFYTSSSSVLNRLVSEILMKEIPENRDTT